MADLLPGAEPAPADLSVRNETEALFTRCMSALTKPERETLLLFLGGRSHQQIAEFLGVPVGTVKRRIHDARDRLQKAMNGSLESAIGRKTKSGQATVDRALNIRKAGSRMAALLKAVSSATLDAVSELYRTCDWIHIANGQINREPVDLDAYEAIVARVKINTNLLGDRFVPGATAQVCLIFKGVERVFDAKVTSDSGIVLTLQKK